MEALGLIGVADAVGERVEFVAGEVSVARQMSMTCSARTLADAFSQNRGDTVRCQCNSLHVSFPGC